jgi:uroporphyrinogen-III decarboxylase
MNMTTKERIMATIRRQPVDHLPLCFNAMCHGTTGFVRDRCHGDPIKTAQFFMELGVDTGIPIQPETLPAKGVVIKEWVEHPADEPLPVRYKEYQTPKGALRQVVRKTVDYPASSIALFTDHNVPAKRSITYLVEKEQDLDALECLLLLPRQDEDLDRFRQDAARYKNFCRENGLVFSGCVLGVGDSMMYLSPIENTLMNALENPGVVARFADILSRWSGKLVEFLLDIGVDLIVRRGWYESADFWSPALYRRFLFEPLKKDIEATHQAGAVLTYVMNSGSMPLLDIFNELGFDIYSNIDPLVTNADLATINRKVGERITLCGGVNNNMVLERGSVEDVRTAVMTAVEKLSRNGGYILAPGNSIGFETYTDVAIRNFYAMVDIWKEIR